MTLIFPNADRTKLSFSDLLEPNLSEESRFES